MSESASTSKSTLWIGRVLSGLIVIFMAGMGSYVAFVKPELAKDTHDKYGYPTGAIQPMLIASITAAVLYAIPQTCVFGAILLTGYLGGAVATHVHAGEPFWMPLIFGIVVWLALLFREPRLRNLLPFRM